MIKTRNVDPASPMRYTELQGPNISTTAAITNAVPLFVWHFPARYPVNLTAAAASFPQATTPWVKIVDVIVYQAFAGVGGTSQTLNVFKNGTTIFATNPVVSLAGGANSAADSAGVIALPSGYTRPVLTATTANLLLKKGDVLTFTVPTVTGAYTTAPNLSFVIVIDNNPV
jgi:hypothetical protein